MQGWRGLGRAAVLLLAAVSLVGCSWFAGGTPRQQPNTSPLAPKATATGNQKLAVIGFYDDRQEKNKGQILDTVKANKGVITELAPFWYKVNADGSLVDNSEQDVRRFAKQNNIGLLPLITNANGTDKFLNNAGARHKAVANLVALLDKNKSFDGLSIDFQLLSPGTRNNLTAFMQELYPQVHKRHKKLSIDVIPHGQADDASEPYSYKALAKHVDQIVLMTYDNHSDASKPGPVANLAWVKKRVQVALKAGIKPDQLVVGVASYGYDWVKGTTKATTVPMKMATQQAKGGSVQRAADGSPHFTYSDKQGRTHVVWYEDGTSVARKIAYAAKMNLHGIAIWRLGYENQAYWDAVKKGVK